MAVDTVSGTHDDLLDPIRDRQITKTAREGLLLNMGMGQHPCTQHGAIGGQDVKAISIVVPPLIRMTDRGVDMEQPAPRGAHSNVQDIRFAGVRRHAPADAKRCEQPAGS